MCNAPIKVGFLLTLWSKHDSRWPKSVKFGQKAPFFMPQLKIKIGDLYINFIFFSKKVL